MAESRRKKEREGETNMHALPHKNGKQFFVGIHVLLQFRGERGRDGPQHQHLHYITLNYEPPHNRHERADVITQLLWNGQSSRLSSTLSDPPPHYYC